jgi:hypothetical protein
MRVITLFLLFGLGVAHIFLGIQDEKFYEKIADTSVGLCLLSLFFASLALS